MPFVEIPGMPGKLYIPGNDECTKRKHNCQDCYSCQMCSDERCSMCLRRRPNIRTEVKDSQKGGCDE